MSRSNQIANHKETLLYAENYCIANNLRFTYLRRRALEIIRSSPKALTAAEIMSIIEANQPPLTYRALEFLTRHKLIHHLASINAYVASDPLKDTSKNQFLICEVCRAVHELQLRIITDKLVLHVENQKFFTKKIIVEILGTCAKCQN